jgi:hypothetical protein
MRETWRQMLPVKRVVLVWIAAHLVLWLLLGLPGFLQCQAAARSAGSCGSDLALAALAVGGVQLVYGFVGGLILALIPRFRSVGQGILIGMSIVMLFHTALCFGTAALTGVG